MTLVWRLRAGVEVGRERLANLFDLALEAGSMEEGNEDVLLRHLSGLRVLDVLVDLSIFDENIATSCPKENLLEEEEVFPQDDARNKA